MVKIRLILVLAVLVVICSTCMAKTITVGPIGQNYNSIQAAIDSANSGDIINVYNGTYYENINIKKQVVLKGFEMPVIDAGYNGSAITLSTDGITVEGFKIINSMGTETGGGGIQVSSNGNTIRNNEASDNQIGICLVGARRNNIINNIAKHNMLDGICAYFLSNNNNISNNSAIANSQVGILIYESANNKVTGNSINCNNGNTHGIYLISSTLFPQKIIQ